MRLDKFVWDSFDIVGEYTVGDNFENSGYLDYGEFMKWIEVVDWWMILEVCPSEFDFIGNKYNKCDKQRCQQRLDCCEKCWEQEIDENEMLKNMPEKLVERFRRNKCNNF